MAAASGVALSTITNSCSAMGPINTTRIETCFTTICTNNAAIASSPTTFNKLCGTTDESICRNFKSNCIATVNTDTNSGGHTVTPTITSTCCDYASFVKYSVTSADNASLSLPTNEVYPPKNIASTATISCVTAPALSICSRSSAYATATNDRHVSNEKIMKNNVIVSMPVGGISHQQQSNAAVDTSLILPSIKPTHSSLQSFAREETSGLSSTAVISSQALMSQSCSLASSIITLPQQQPRQAYIMPSESIASTVTDDGISSSSSSVLSSSSLVKLHHPHSHCSYSSCYNRIIASCNTSVCQHNNTYGCCCDYVTLQHSCHHHNIAVACHENQCNCLSHCHCSSFASSSACHHHHLQFLSSEAAAANTSHNRHCQHHHCSPTQMRHPSHGHHHHHSLPPLAASISNDRPSPQLSDISMINCKSSSLPLSCSNSSNNGHTYHRTGLLPSTPAKASLCCCFCCRHQRHCHCCTSNRTAQRHLCCSHSNIQRYSGSCHRLANISVVMCPPLSQHIKPFTPCYRHSQHSHCQPIHHHQM